MNVRATGGVEQIAPPATANEAALDPIAFYEDEGVLANYQHIRDRADGPKLGIEEPIVLDFLGNLKACSILDLGCGDARLGREACARGALGYLGLDGSRRMVALAQQTLAGTGAGVRLQNLETWQGFAERRFDVVVSQLAFQYITNLPRLFDLISRQLKPRGLFVFSVEHPIVTSSYQGTVNSGIASGWHVSRYFEEGSRVDAWLNSAVVKQHHALQTYFNLLLDSGFQLERFSEGRPDAGRFAERTIYEQRLNVPLCAIFRARLG